MRNTSLARVKLWNPSEQFEKQTDRAGERPAAVPSKLFVFTLMFILQEGSEMTRFFFHLHFNSLCVNSFIHIGGAHPYITHSLFCFL